MIRTIDAEIFTVEDEEVWSKDSLLEFFDSKGSEAILEFRNGEEFRHVTMNPYKGVLEIKDARVRNSEDLFRELSTRLGKQSMWIVCDPDGNYQTVLRWIPSYYNHLYDYEGKPDLELLNRYDTLFLYGLNEYAVILYKDVLPLWKGKKVILCGEWNTFAPFLPGLSDKEVILIPDWKEGTFFKETEPNVLHIIDNRPENESLDRYVKDHILLYDEVMVYTFCFANLLHLGDLYPDKKFLLIDGTLNIEGIFGIWDKVFTMARFAKGKGYVPVFGITKADYNIYSDHSRDDIWNKFMKQPDGYRIEDVIRAKNVYLSPNANILNIMRHIMTADTPPGTELDWSGGMFNQAVESYIKQHGSILKNPDETLGVLIRGTDYTKTHMPGHAKHASVEEIIEKISETEADHPYKWIYLATEDQEILDQMKEIYKERLLYTDQERFVIQPGQLLRDLTDGQEKKEGEGFRRGAEYLCTLRLLSRCESLIASGSCGGVSEAVRENGGKYRFVYVFDHGINPRG